MSQYMNNSLVLFFTSETLLYIGMAIGAFAIIHSYTIHGKNLKLIRVLSDLAAFALIMESICFLIIMKKPNPSVVEQVVTQNIWANAVFGAIVQGCDNYLTFARYQAVAGGTSTAHKYAAFTYVIVLLYISWWPFFTFLPIGFNMNSPAWLAVQVVVATWINFISYLLYDIFYSGMVIAILVKHVRSNTAATDTSSLQMLAKKALGHSLMSCAGIFCYSFYIPLGIVEQNILIVTGIHFFLNWPESHLILYKLYWLLGGNKYKVVPKTGPSSKAPSSGVENKSTVLCESNDKGAGAELTDSQRVGAANMTRNSTEMLASIKEGPGAIAIADGVQNC